jgi:succinate-acetate transporter protein
MFSNKKNQDISNSNKQNNEVYTIIPINERRNYSNLKTRNIKNEQLKLFINNLPEKTIIGNPTSLGLGAFALTTFMISVFNAGSNLIDQDLEGVVLPVALFYGGIAQFAAGMWEFRTNNTFGATAFTSYGAFWMSNAAYIYFIVPTISSTGKVQNATGLFLLSWFIFTLYMNVAAVKTSKLLFILFATLNLTFLFLIIGNLKNISVLINIGGWFGIVTAFIAWYGSAAILIDLTWKTNILPIGIFHPKLKK